MTKQRLGFKIPEVCQKPCLKHYDISCCVFAFPFKVICVKRNTEDLYTHRCSVPIQDTKEVSSGDVLISLLKGERTGKRVSMLPRKNGILISKNDTTHSKPGIKCERFDIEHHPFFYKNPHTMLKFSHQMTADILPEIYTLDNETEPLVLDTPCSIFTNAQLWLNTLMKIHFLFRTLHNNFPALTSRLSFSISIVNFASKLITLKLSNFSGSVISSVQSRSVEHSQMVSADLQFQNSSLLNCCLLGVKENALNIFKTLISSSFHSLFTLYLEIKCHRPLNMDICLIGQAWELSFIVIGQHDSSMKFNIVLIPTLDTSSNIINFNMIIREHYAISFKQQHVKILCEKKSWSLSSGSFHIHGSAWNSELCNIVFMYLERLNHAAFNSSATPRFTSSFSAVLTILSSQTFSLCSKTCPTLVISKNYLPICNTTRNMDNYTKSFCPNPAFPNAKYQSNRPQITERDHAQISFKVKENIFNESSQVQTNYKLLTSTRLKELNEFHVPVKRHPNNLVKVANICRRNTHHLLSDESSESNLIEKRVNAAKSSSLEANIENAELLYHQRTSRKPSHFPLNDVKQKFSESACDEIHTDENSFNFEHIGKKRLSLNVTAMSAVRKQDSHIASDDIVKLPNLSSENLVSQRSLLRFKELHKETDQRPEGIKAVSIENNAIPFVGLQVATATRINISEELVNGIEDKFYDFIDKEMIATEMLPSEDSNSFQKDLFSFKSSFKEHPKEKHLISKETSAMSVENNLKTIIVGFQTASGKKINISKEAINTIKNKFSDFISEMEDTETLFATNSESLQNDSLNLGSNSKEHQKKNNFPEETNSVSIINSLIKAPFIGFRTAAGKNINVSEESINVVNNKFSDLLSDHLVETEILRSKNSERFQKVISEKAINSDKNKLSDISDDVVKTETLSSANYDPLRKALLKLSSKDHSIEKDLYVENTRGILTASNLNETPNFGFKNGARKGVHISEKALNKSKFPDISNKAIFSINSQPLQKMLTKSNSKNPSGENSLFEKKTDIISIEDNLNTTSVIGSQTAAGKTIAVSEKTTNSVKRKFCDLISNEMVEIETLSSTSSESPQEALCDSLSSSKDLSKIDSLMLEQTHSISNEGNLNKTFLGFQTAAGKEINVSEKALNAARNKFSDLIVDEMVENKNLSSILYGPVNQGLLRSKSDSEEFSNENDQLSEKKKDDLLTENNLSKMPLIGFQTAAGKEIKVSDKALNAAKNKFSDLIFDEMVKSEAPFPVNPEPFQKVLLQSSLKELSRENHLFPKKTDAISVENNLNKTPCIGFQTAAGKKISVSDKALNAARNKFSDFISDEVLETEMSSSTNSYVTISHYSRLSPDKHPKMNNPLSEEGNTFPVKDNLSKTLCIGFQTATRKKINVSEKAINAVKNKYSDIFDDAVETETLSSANYDHQKPLINSSSKDHSKENDLYVENTHGILTGNNLNEAPCFGFQTVAEQKILISQEVLNTVKCQFHDIINKAIFSINSQPLRKVLSGPDFKNLSEENNLFEKKTDVISIENLNTSFIGSQTGKAAGKRINVSEKTTNSVKRKFCDLISNEMVEIETLSSTSSEPPQKALCSSLSSSKGFPKINSHMLEQTHSISNEDNLNKTFLGFQTAAGKEINVSEKALNAARNKFSDLIFEEVVENENLSSVIYGEPVDQLLLRSKSDSKECSNENDQLSEKNDDSLTENSLSKMPFIGFQTAAGKEIKVSDKALNAAKNKFSDIIFDEMVENENLSSVIYVEPVDQRLLRSKSDSKECSNENDQVSEKNDDSLTENSLGKMPFIGFQTAAEKEIKVSDKALNAAKNKFSDIIFDEMVENENLSSVIYVEPVDQLLLRSKSDSKECSNENDQLSEKYDDSLTENSLSKMPFIGFQTAAGKEIKVSDKALNAAKNKFSDIIFDEMVENENLSSVIYGEPVDQRLLRSKSDSKECSNENDQLSEKYDYSLTENSLSKMPFIGFQTAAGKEIKVSDKALNAAKNKFSDLIFDEMIKGEAPSSVNPDPFPKVLLQSSFKELSTENHLFPKKTNAISPAGKKISASEQANNVFQGKFSDVPCEMVFSLNSEPFQKCLSLPSSKDAPRENMFTEKTGNVLVENSLNTTPFVGFQTRTENKITVREKALNISQNKFSDMIPGETVETGPQSVAISEHEHSDIGLLISQSNLWNQSSATPNICSFQNKNTCIVFQTAAGKRVKISEKSLHATKRKFSDLLDTELESGELDTKSMKVSNLKSSSKNLLKENISPSEMFTPVFTSPNVRPIKFHTEAGNNINVFEKALGVVKPKFLNEFMNEHSLVHEAENLLPVAIVSKYSDLEQQSNYKNFLDEGNLLCQNHDPSSVEQNSLKSAFLDCQTAAGKDMDVSEKNLNPVRRKFSSLCEDNLGITLPSYKQKELSVISNPKNKATKKSNPSFVDNLNSNEIVGFQTAAGKNINVSQKALSYVKNKFFNQFDAGSSRDEKLSPASSESATMEPLTSCSFEKEPKRQQSGEESLPSLSKNAITKLQTVAGKNISTVEDTPNTVKRKCCDLLSGETVPPVASDSVVKPLLSSDCSSEADPKKKRFCTKSDSFLVENLSLAFQTAAGKAVSISDEALNTVKKNFSHAVCNDVIENESLSNSEFFEKFQNLNFDLENGANKELIFPSSTTALCIESNENAFNGFDNATEKSRNVSETTVKQKYIHTPFNEIAENEKSVSVDSETLNSNANWKRSRMQQPNRIEIVDFDYCRCFQCNKTSENYSPHSKENSLSECSFICPDCHKPCKLATIRFAPKKHIFYDLLHANFIHRKVHKKLYSVTMHKLQRTKSSRVHGERYKISNLPLSNEETVTNNDKVVEDIQQNIIFQVEQLREQQAHRIAIKKQVKIMPGQLAILKRDHSKTIHLRNLTAKSPPGSYTSKQLLSFGVRQHALEINSVSAETFVFKEKDFREYTSPSPFCFTIGDNALVILDEFKCAGKKEFFSAFLDSPGVDPSLISEAWFYNHYRWIVWKLASLEFSFPSLFGGNSLTPHRVMLQMKLRYDYEIDSSKRSALKRIVERDDTPSKTLVLFVSSISRCETEKSENKGITENVFRMKLSDGWYEIQTNIDAAMENLIKKNRVAVGSKIMISGAELCGSDVACSPLEIPDCLRLRIHTNSTRMARWDVKLGYFIHRRPFPVPVSSIISDGGCIGHIRIVVNRIYPILYLEKYENGPRITRNEKMESRIQEHHQKLQEHHLNQIRKSVWKAFEERLGEENACRRKQHLHRCNLLAGEELFEALNCAVDVQAFLESLDDHQISILKEFEKKQMERKHFQMEEEINNAITEAKNVGEYPVDRNVTPVLKVFVKGCHMLDHHSNKDVILNIWRPSSDMLELFTEGTALGIYYLHPNRYQNDIIHLNSIKTTRYERINLERNLIEDIYQPRKVTELGDIAKYCNNSIIDIVGFIFHVTDSSENVRSKDMIYVANADFNSLVIKFSDGLASTGCQDFLTVGNVVAVCNLKLDTNPNDFPVCSTATLITTFSCNPKAIYLNEAVENLKQWIKDPLQFIKQAKIILESELEKRSRKSKYGFSNCNYGDNSDKRQKSVNIASNIICNETLNTVDRVTNQPSPFLSKCEPKKLFTSVEERLLNLGSLPSPPPLPKLTINASLSARANFKSPK